MTPPKEPNLPPLLMTGPVSTAEEGSAAAKHRSKWAPVDSGEGESEEAARMERYGNLRKREDEERGGGMKRGFDVGILEIIGVINAVWNTA